MRFAGLDVPTPVLLAGGLAGLVLLVRGTALARPRVRDPASAHPAAYARGKLHALQLRRAGPLGDALRIMVPLEWPHTPVSVWLGFTASAAGPDDNTAITASGQLKRRWNFHEIGEFQTTAGRPTSVHAPERTRPANDWLRLAPDARTRRLLHAATGTLRDATLVPDAWSTPEAAPDRAAIGLVSLRDHYDGVKRLLPTVLHPTHTNSVWAVAMAFTGWSAGPVVAARSIARFGATIAPVDDARRMGAWAQALVAARHRGESMGGRPETHGNAAYDWLRTAQKLASGELLGSTAHEDTAWYGESWATPGPLQDAVTRIAFGA
jgi:hypothetical protein